MRADIVEITWQRRLALRGLACALSELKCLAAETRLERAMRRHGRALQVALKAGYRPDQPRVPKGNEDGGQWTATDANGNPLSKKPGRENLVRVAGPWPSNDPPEPLDDEKLSNFKERPETSVQRTSIIKYVARRMAETGATFAFFASAMPWLLNYEAETLSLNDPPKTLKELRSDLSPKPGYHRHHINEQGPARAYGFSEEVIEHADNLVRIPKKKHEEITAWYARENPDFGGVSPREYLAGRSWAVRRAVGLDALRKFGVLRP